MFDFRKVVSFLPRESDAREQRFAQQLRKGVLEMLVLQLLAEQPGHGYGLILQLRQRSSGLLDLKEGTLYPILYRLEDEGCIVSAWAAPEETASRGRTAPRKIYTITPAGRETLAVQQTVWQEFSACVNHICGGKHHG